MTIRTTLLTFFFVLFINAAHCQCFDQKPFDMGNNAINKVEAETIEHYTNSFMGCSMPDFMAVTIDSTKISNTSLRGRVTMFYFWGLHDGFSVQEIPYLNRVADTFKNEKVNFIAICRDDSSRWDRRCEKFFHFKHIARSKNLLSKFNCRPVAIIFDKNGRAISFDFAWLSLDQKIIDDRSQQFIDTIRKALKN